MHEVHWRTGDTVEYGASLYLRPGFSDAVQGQVDLLRWDNFPTHPLDTDWGGVSVFGSDRRARLVRFGAGRAGTDELVGPFDLPEGRWFRLVVRQTLGPAGGAHSVVELDGRPIGESRAPNAYGRGIQRVRHGIVAVGAGVQERPLEVLVHDAYATPRPPAPRHDRCLTTARTRPAA